MSDDTKEGEILPAVRTNSSAVAAPLTSERMRRSNPSGVVDSAVTRFVAGLRQRANQALAADAHARADYFDAVGRVAKSFIGMNQALDEVRELEAILALDRIERSASREERKLDIDHRRKLAENQRKQELVEAERGAFTSEQGLENQKRLKELNLEIWQKRKEAEQLDAESIAAKLRGDGGPEKKKSRNLVEELQTQAEKLEKEILEAEADGKDSGGDRMALAELRAMIARLRGR
jgi:hypothetical protein